MVISVDLSLPLANNPRSGSNTPCNRKFNNNNKASRVTNSVRVTINSLGNSKATLSSSNRVTAKVIRTNSSNSARDIPNNNRVIPSSSKVTPLSNSSRVTRTNNSRVIRSNSSKAGVRVGVNPDNNSKVTGSPAMGNKATANRVTVSLYTDKLRDGEPS